MIKKIGILVTAVMVAISSASFAADVKIKNVATKTYYYKVGTTAKPIKANATASFKYTGKTVKVTYSSNSKLTGSKSKTFASSSIVKNKNLIQINPVKGKTTPTK